MPMAITQDPATFATPRPATPARSCDPLSSDPDGRTAGAPPVENFIRLRPLNAAELLDITAIIFLSAPLAFLGMALILVGVPRLLLLGLEILASRNGAMFDPGGGWATAVRAGVAASIVLGLGLCSVSLARIGNDVWFGRTVARSAPEARRGSEILRATPVLIVYTILWLPVFVATVPMWTWPNDWVPPVVLTLWYPAAVALSVPVSLLPIVRLAEGRGTLRALGRSFGLARLAGWWRMSLSFLILAFLLGALVVAIAVGAGWISEWLDLLDGSIPSHTLEAGVDIAIMALLGSVISLVPVAAYADLRVRREGLDIQMLVLEQEQRRR